MEEEKEEEKRRNLNRETRRNKETANLPIPFGLRRIPKPPSQREFSKGVATWHGGPGGVEQRGRAAVAIADGGWRKVKGGRGKSRRGTVDY